MICMSTYAERLAWAMSVRGMNPHSEQSELARRVGMGCKPQNIQHLLDPNKNAKFSKYSARIAEVLQIDPQWLAYETGAKPQAEEGSTASSSTPPVVRKGRALTDEYMEYLGTLDVTQLHHASLILHRLKGQKLTKALAFLQELESADVEAPVQDETAGGLIIEGGQPDPIPNTTKRRISK